jgi:hypothetical protein
LGVERFVVPAHSVLLSNTDFFRQVLRRRSQPELRTPDVGHDETCVGGFFAVFRHRDKSSAPPRVMRRLARLQRTNLQVTIGRCKANVRTKGRFFAAYPGTGDAEGPAAFRAMDTDYQFISSDLEQVCPRMRLPPLGSGAVRRTRCIS